jgi:formylglycine-generating enzyme required for sulfatase activity/DNA-directed RNA polymerase subunit RPC12/RpoP
VEVVYCNNCGIKIASDAFSTGTAVRGDDGRIYCGKCDSKGQMTVVGAPVVKASALEQSVTRFYFCETCGKRITDKQILEGLGRDKKLKGIFCKDCAVGVMTMEFAAISDADLRKPVRKSGGNAVPESTESPAVQSASRAGIAAAVRSPSPGKPSERIKTEHIGKGTRRVEQRDAATATIIAGVAAAVLVAVVVTILGSQSSGSSRPDTASSRTHDPAQGPVQAVAPVAPKGNSNFRISPSKPPLPTDPPIEAAITIPQKPDPEAAAKADYDEMVKRAQSMEGSAVGRTEVIDGFLKVHGDSAFANQARVLKDDISAMETLKDSQPAKAPSLPPTVETAKQQPAATPPVSVKVADKGVARNQLADILKELAPLLKRNQFSSADKLLDEKLHDPGLTVIVDQLKREKSDITEIESLRRRGMEALRAKAGSVVTLKKGAMTGTVKAEPNVDGIVLALKDGPELTVTTSQLNAEDIDSLLPPEKGAGKAEDLRSRGLLFQAAGDADRAEDYFIKARDAGSGDAVAPYLERIAGSKLELREAAALESWKKAELLFTNKNWKAAKQAYETLQHDYAGSAALVNNAGLLQERLEAIGWALGPPREISLDLGGDVKMEMVLIPAGEFEMGSNDGEKGEKPVHKVKLSQSYYMGKYVVTQAQYEKVMGKNPSVCKGEDLPVDSVNYVDAEAFCKKAGKFIGRPIRIPTEAEWEYACRAGTKTKYITGDDPAALEQVGWFKENAAGKTHPVGQKKPNAWGLFDMQGNVFQWCQDWYAEDYYGKSETENPHGTEQKNAQGLRVMRGSIMGEPMAGCRSARRMPIHNQLNHDSPQFGFRVVMELVSRTP